MNDHIIFRLSSEAKKVDLSDRKRKNGQGSNWCWSGTRKVIYTAAGHKCTWCGNGTETDGLVLSLDHIIPSSYGGNNKKANLVTCCVDCNSARGDKLVPEWLSYMEEILGYSEEQLSAAKARMFRAYTNHTTSAWLSYRRSAIDSGYLVKTKKGYR